MQMLVMQGRQGRQESFCDVWFVGERTWGSGGENDLCHTLNACTLCVPDHSTKKN